MSKVVRVGFKQLGMRDVGAVVSVVGVPSLKKVDFAVHRDPRHEAKRARREVERFVAKLGEHCVCNVLDVGRHVGTVHTNQVARKRTCNELFFSRQSFLYNFEHSLLVELVLHVTDVEKGCKLKVQVLVGCNQVV